YLLLISSHAPPRDLHSFPTRRSSDLDIYTGFLRHGLHRMGVDIRFDKQCRWIVFFDKVDRWDGLFGNAELIGIHRPIVAFGQIVAISPVMVLPFGCHKTPAVVFEVSTFFFIMLL